jgi:predicted RNA-binding protein with PUA-like domain
MYGIEGSTFMAYWLFKSEPTAYSFQHLLAEPDQTTGWDGVRNYQARNFLRDQVKVGDGVLFYHSNADPPCIAGIAEVVEEGHRGTRYRSRRSGRSSRRSVFRNWAASLNSSGWSCYARGAACRCSR